jgi:hypothetical protein
MTSREEAVSEQLEQRYGASLNVKARGVIDHRQYWKVHPMYSFKPLVSATMAVASVLALSSIYSAAQAQTDTAATPPGQIKTGPGGKDYLHAGVRISQGGSGPNAFYVFEPTNPKPASAPLVIITHGYTEYAGYGMHKELIMHTVKKGNVVIYPRYQTGYATPCLGPLNSEACMNSATKGIQGGIKFLQSDSNRVQPELQNTSYFGFSYGGIITTNLTNRWASLNLPKPRAIFLDEPHDGQVEAALDKDLSGIPATTLVQCHVGADGVISNAPNNSCNTVFPRLGHIPEANKNLVMLYTDTHGKPQLSSKHGVSMTPTLNTYDWRFVWKSFDAMRSCALADQDCEYGMGDTPEHRSNGSWSDGTPVKELKIQTVAPIAP